ncbi:MAG: hypothetical protein M0R74_20620 [Dehalococcoidia bacterium]|nr:hypothetical protein [Dehalococcoidia bacterium]
MPRTKERKQATSTTSDRNNANSDERKLLQQHGNKLSKSTMRAKWIHSPEEREDRKGQTLATRSHDVIKAWADERGATPATVEGTQHSQRAGVLRFAFNDEAPKGRLRPLEWNEWFHTFDDRELIFLHQQHLRNGNQSNFFRFDSPHREDA